MEIQVNGRKFEVPDGETMAGRGNSSVGRGWQGLGFVGSNAQAMMTG